VVQRRLDSTISHVDLPSAHHLYWPDLDIDLAVASLTQPDRYPLISQAPPNANGADAPVNADGARLIRRR
jgi:hypothetical protein